MHPLEKPKLTILVAQQEDYDREAMVTLLDRGSLRVMGAKDGRDALKLIKEFKPEILVTDVALDHVDGVELIRQGRDFNEEMKVVVAFGPYDPKRLFRAVEEGAEACIALPADGAKLRRAVMRCARDIALRRRMNEADYSLKQLLDFFPSPALLADGLEVTYYNQRLTRFLGYADHENMTSVDIGLEDFIIKLNEEPYDNHPQKWLETIINDPLDRDILVHIENPRHPEARPNAFTVTHRQFPGSDLRLFSFQDVSSMEDERLHLEDEASTDPLTKALNRRSFLRLLGQLGARDESFGLIMFDIDHFKSINDTFGHDVGDAVLREISALVRENIRETDTLARWGGEEFMIVSVGADMQRTLQAAERLREAVSQFDFTGVDRTVTSSFGVAVARLGETMDDLVKRVDDALYEAKETGRNKVVTAK